MKINHITYKTFYSVLLLSAVLLSSLTLRTASLAASTSSVIYVSPGATGSCTSWTESCDLQIALSAARPGDEIWVVAGIYYPGPAGSRIATFQLRNGVALYGGFAGWETSRQQRNWSENVTILSGDIDRNDILDSGNSYHVVTAIETGATAVLDGFTITGGNANGYDPYNNYGGGMVIISASPALNNVIFHGNRATIRGGGIYIDNNSSPTLINVTFSVNSTNSRGGGLYVSSSAVSMINAAFSNNSAVDTGGGIFSDSSVLTLNNVAFYANTSETGGGLASLNNSSPSLTNVTFYENHAKTRGGGMYNHLSSPRLTNVTFSTNSAEAYGGGMDNAYNSSPVLTNVTFSNNTALVGPGLYSHDSSSPVLTNTIIWGSGHVSGEQNQIFGPATVTYSIIQGRYPGEGNLDADPLLQVLGINGGFTMTHALSMGSPAINAGHPISCPPQDQRGMPRPANGSFDGEPRCDIGAFEFQPGIVYLPVVNR